MVPSVDACFALMDRYEMLDHIRIHSIMVAKIAHLISKSLRAAGVDISIELSTIGALMHDIGKTQCLGTPLDHAGVGRQICIENEFHEIAEIVGQHVRLKDYVLNNGFTEREVVYYADKRVNHDQVVALDDRMAYIMNRYGRKQAALCEAIRANFEICKAVEKKIFGMMNFGNEDLGERARDEDLRTCMKPG